MNKLNSFILLFLFLQIGFSQSHLYLVFPRSTASMGMGEQSVSLKNPISAMTGNPANLVYEDGATLSFYRNPLYFFGWGGYPLSNFITTFNYNDKNYFGLEYNNFDGGELNVDGNKFIKQTEKSFSLAYARRLGNSFSLGSKLTYARSGDFAKSNTFLLSLGLSYTTKFFDRDANFGLAFLNFGDRVKYKTWEGEEGYDINPTQLKMGMNYDFLVSPLVNSYLAVEFEKNLISFTNNEADNSFKALLKDWKDFPEDVSFKFGIGLHSSDISLGRGFGFNNRYYLGYVTTGKWVGEFLTFGTSLGINYKDFSFGLGYSGIWFTQRNLISGAYIGYETFNFIFYKKFNWSNEKKSVKTSPQINPQKYLISFGTSYTVPTGLLKENVVDMVKYSNKPILRYEIDFEFFFNERYSYLASLNYWRTQEKIELLLPSYIPPIHFNSEHFSVLMGLGFYPFEGFLNGLYLQSKIGVLRRNPIPDNYYPKYSYYPIINFSGGYKLNLFNSNFYLVPSFEFSTYFVETLDDIFSSKRMDKIFGFKYVNYGLKLGYRI
jgi:hypothetical protein